MELRSNNVARSASPFMVPPAPRRRSLFALSRGQGGKRDERASKPFLGTGLFNSRDQRQNRRTARAPRCRRSWYVGAALVVGLSGVLDMAWSACSRYVMQHPYFTVQEIVVNSDGPFSAEEVQRWGGLAPGMNLWMIDPAQVEARLRAHSWIHTAQVRREFPQRVYLTVRTRRPIAIVLHQSLTYLDDTGVCFAGRQYGAALDLPYVSGLRALPLNTPIARSALTGVSHLLSLANLWQEPLSEIHWDQQQGYTLFLARRRITIRLGWHTTPEKFAQVGMALAAWPLDGPAAVFDARFADQVVVRPYAAERQLPTHDLTRPL